MTFDDRWLVEAVMELLAHAVDNNAEAVTERVVSIAELRDAAGIHGLCYALADVGMRFGLGVEERGTGFTAMQTPGPLGLPVEPESAPVDGQPHIWAARFVAAYANGDSDTLNALFNASMTDPERHVADVAALIHLAASVLRERLRDR